MLTQVGVIFHEHAERVMRALEQASQSVQDLQGAGRGRLVVGALPTVNFYLIASSVARFKRRFPGIHLHVHAQPSSDIVAALLANRLDVGICPFPAASDR